MALFPVSTTRVIPFERDHPVVVILLQGRGDVLEIGHHLGGTQGTLLDARLGKIHARGLQELKEQREPGNFAFTGFRMSVSSCATVSL